MTYTIEATTMEEVEKYAKEQELRTRNLIHHDLHHQNGQATGNPMFCVMEEVTSCDVGLTEVGEMHINTLREIFFTRREAEEYIENYQHEHRGGLFIYIKSGNRNAGWIWARELLMGGVK